MGKEATSWEWLRDGITKALPAYSLLERVENGVCPGMADVCYSIKGVDGWIELKAVPLPARASTPVLTDKEGLNINQINWHIARQRVNSKTWVFVSAKPCRWLVSGIYAREINSWTADQFTAKARIATLANWKDHEWKMLIRALTNQ